MYLTERDVPNLHDVDLRLLRVYDAVARHRGLSAAQQELGVTQATISNQLATLETRLGVRLCTRGRGGFALTEQGRIVLDASRALFRSIETFRGTVGTAKGELTGAVRFGMVDALLSNDQIPLHDAIGRFAKLAPRASLHIEIASPQDLLQGLAEDHFHLVLAPAEKLPPRYRGIRMFTESQGLYCGRNHPLYDRNQTEIHVEEISGFPFVARSYMPNLRVPVRMEFNAFTTASHMESIALLILSGRYIGYLPKHFARAWENKGEMRSILDKSTAYEDRFYLLFRDREFNKSVEVLYDCLRGCVSGKTTGS